MSKIERVEFQLNRKNLITTIEVESATADDIDLLCSELARCCGCTSVVITTSGDTYHIMPTTEVDVGNLPETYELVQEQLADFVADISFVQDKTADATTDLMDMLEIQLIEKVNLSDTTKSPHQKRLLDYEILKISTLINYIAQERWNCHCEQCGKILLTRDILTMHNTVCIECQKKTTM